MSALSSLLTASRPAMLRQLRTLLVVAFTLITLVAAVAWHGGSTDDKDGKGRLPVLRPAGPTWYKGNLHTHSFWSDGDDFPEMIADWYKRQGYHFLGLSDHNVLAEGEKWVEVTEKGFRPVAVKKYRERFGPSWVEDYDRLFAFFVGLVEAGKLGGGRFSGTA